MKMAVKTVQCACVVCMYNLMYSCGKWLQLSPVYVFYFRKAIGSD